MCGHFTQHQLVSSRQSAVSQCVLSLFTQEADYSGRTGVPHAIEITTGANTTHSVTQSLLLCALQLFRDASAFLSLSVAPKASSCVSRDCTFSLASSCPGKVRNCIPQSSPFFLTRTITKLVTFIGTEKDSFRTYMTCDHLLFILLVVCFKLLNLT